MLRGEAVDHGVINVPNVFPKFLKLGGTQQSHFMDAISVSPNVTSLGSVTLVLNRHTWNQTSKDDGSD